MDAAGYRAWMHADEIHRKYDLPAIMIQDQLLLKLWMNHGAKSRKLYNCNGAMYRNQLIMLTIGDSVSSAMWRDRIIQELRYDDDA